MPELIKAAYHCSQGSLYSVCRTGWGLCKDNVSRFSPFKAKYSAVFCDTMIQKITDAENLPDTNQRNANENVLHIILKEKAGKVIDDFRLLKRYIRDAFADEYHNAHYNASGQTHFTKALNSDWKCTGTIGTEMNNFISKYAATLAVNLDGQPNMPSGFPNQVADDVEDFAKTWQDFLSAEETTAAQQKKIIANNAVYKAFRSLTDDAHAIGRAEKDAAFANEFVFQRIFRRLHPRPAGAKGRVTNISVNQYEEGVTATLQKAGEKAIVLKTDKKGWFRYLHLAAGEYTLTLEKAGLVTITAIVKIKTGVVRRLKFEMKAEVAL